MWKRYGLISLTVISIFWIGYISTDLINRENELDPQEIFGLEDSTVFIANRYQEINWGKIDAKFPPRFHELISQLTAVISDEQSIYLSEKRTHFLIETKFNWSIPRLKRVFKKCHLALKSEGLNQFRYGDLQVDFHRNKLYFFVEQLETTKVEGWEKFDQRSSGTLVQFQKPAGFLLTDIYFKGTNLVTFVTKKNSEYKGAQAYDQQLFAQVLPLNFDSYHFWEKEYFAQEDAIFKKGPMYQWMQSGLVALEIDSSIVYVSDYKDGQNPVHVLCDEAQTEPENGDYQSFSGIDLLSTIRKSDDFHVFHINEMVMISTNKELCEQLISDFKMGKSLIEHEDRLQEIFSQLPRKVSERYVSKTEKYSRSVYAKRLFQTNVTFSSNSAEVEDDFPSVSIHTSGKIVDYISFPGERNLLVLTQNGRLTSYERGTLKWKKELNGRLVGGIRKLMNNEYMLITLSNSIHVINKEGNYLFGGPIDISTKQAAAEASFFTYKGQNLIVYPSRNNEVVRINANGAVHSVTSFKSGNIDSPIDCWLSQSRLFFGVKCGTTFTMIDADRKAVHRSFDLHTEDAIGVSQANELFLYSIQQGMFGYTTQKGEIHPISPQKGELIKVIDHQGKEYLIIKNGRQLTFFDAIGTQLGKFSITFDDIESIYLTEVAGMRLISIVDGLENNVYLFNSKGRQLIDQKIEGSKRTTITEHGNMIILSTEIDDYLIQYMIKH